MAKGGSGALKVKKYYLSILYSICLSDIDYIKEIRFDDKTVATGEFQDGTVTINSEELYGGLDREGGVSGNIDIMLGSPTQGVNAFYAAKFPNPPAFRRSVTLLLKDFYVGMNYYLKPFSVVVTKIRAIREGVNAWNASYIEPIPGQMNGVHIIRDLLINPEAMGIDELKIGDSFNAAAITAFNEGLGFSFNFREAKSIEDMLADVEAHLNANVYLDRKTGKYEIKLIRQDYVVANLFVADKTNVKEITSLKRTLIGELFSKVTVRYINGATFKEAVHIEEDFTLSNMQGGAVEKSVEFKGCMSRALAAKLAARELLEVNTPTFGGSLTGNTELEDLNIGDAFVLKADCNDYYSQDIICRVVSLDLGTPLDHRIKVTFMEDIFAAQESFQFTAPETGWVDVINPPVPVVERLLVEAPYYVIAQLVGDAEAKNVDTTDAYMIAAAAQPSIDSSLANVYANGKKQGVLHFCPFGLLANPITKTTTTITLTSVVDVFLFREESFMQIDNEIIGIVSKMVNVFTVIRGCLDTVPEDHLQNAKAFGWEYLNGANGVPYFITETVNVKLLTNTPKAELAIGSAPQDSITMTGRMHLPYPPGNLAINTVTFPSVSLVTVDDLVLTWASRNRFQQTVSLLGYFNGSITSEAGVSYSGELRRIDTNAILTSFTGETGLTRTLITTVTSLTITSGTNVGTLATITTSAAHGFATGRKVRIAGAGPSNYNGLFTITVTGANTFTYTMIADPLGSISNPASVGLERSTYVGQVKLTLWSENANGVSYQKVNHIFNLE
jgi:hypothetical protein